MISDVILFLSFEQPIHHKQEEFTGRALALLQSSVSGMLFRASDSDANLFLFVHALQNFYDPLWPKESLRDRALYSLPQSRMLLISRGSAQQQEEVLRCSRDTISENDFGTHVRDHYNWGIGNENEG